MPAMSYLSLYRKYRSQTFAEVVEQKASVSILQNAVAFNRIGHAYIFSGPRGTGKTSLARLFAKTICCQNLPKEFSAKHKPEPCNKCSNCLTITSGDHMDILEIDAASHTGVDHVRELIEKVHFMPSLAPRKIFIIDEAHMLSNAAFNALLKTLEEPPEHVIFILATTDPQKIPPTIQSRCQRLEFTKIPVTSIVEHLGAICKLEKVSVSDEALNLIAKYSSGHMRDALSILDQVLAFHQGKVEAADIFDAVGSAPVEEVLGILECLSKTDLPAYFQKMDELFLRGIDALKLVSDFMDVLRTLLLLKLDLSKLVLVEAKSLSRFQTLADVFSREQLRQFIRDLSQAMQDIRYMEDSKVYLEILLCETFTAPEAVAQVSPQLPIANHQSPANKSTFNNSTIQPTTAPTQKQPNQPIIESANQQEPADRSDVPLVLDVVSVKHYWSHLIGALKKQRMMKMAAFLMEAIPYKVDGDTITAMFKKDHRFHFENVTESQNRKLLAEIASKVFGRKIELEFVLSEDQQAPLNLGTAQVTEERLIEDSMIPDNVKHIASLFDGKIVNN